MTITTKGLIQRINRKLAREGQKLRTTRGMQMHIDVGDYWIQDISGNYVADKYVDPVELGRKLGVLGPSDVVQ